MLICGYHGLTIVIMLIFVVLLFALAPSKPVINDVNICLLNSYSFNSNYVLLVILQ